MLKWLGRGQGEVDLGLSRLLHVIHVMGQDIHGVEGSQFKMKTQLTSPVVAQRSGLLFKGLTRWSLKQGQEMEEHTGSLQ